MHKIGIAKDPEERVKQLQTGNPFDIEVLWTYGPTKRHFDIETTAHRELAGVRAEGEWFNISKSAAIRAVKRAAGERKRAAWWIEYLMAPAVTALAVCAGCALPFLIARLAS